MKKIKTTKVGKGRLELHSDGKWNVILFKYRTFTYEVLRSTFISIITDYFNSIKKTDDREDAVQFCYSHDDDQWIYFEFIYKSLDMNELDVNLRTYSIEEQEANITGYYDSIDEINRIYGKSSKQIIAECIFESSIY